MCRKNKNDFIYLLLFAMTVPLHKLKQPKPKHMSASDGNVHFHVVCIAFSFSAALFSPAGLSLRHLFFFFFTTLPYANTSSLLRVECVSLEQVPAERNVATRERTIFRAGLPPELSRSLAHPRRCREAASKKSDVEAGLKKERATPGEGN